jgi:hypothetical protein
MAVTISSTALKEIADYLENGMRCWYHIPTGEVLWVPDRMKNFDIDEEIWAEAFNEIDEKMHECIAFEGLDSHEEFRMMAYFAENEVSDHEVRSRLIYALNQRKPFMHFKSAIHYDSDYLKAWYAFNTEWYINEVQRQLDYYNSEPNDSEEEDEDEDDDEV